MSAIAIDRTRRHGLRKVAAVLAALLVLGIAALATLEGWSDSAEQAAFGGLAGTSSVSGFDTTGHHIAPSRVS